MLIALLDNHVMNVVMNTPKTHTKNIYCITDTCPTFSVTVSQWWFYHICAIWDLSTEEEKKIYKLFKCIAYYNVVQYIFSTARNS